MQKQVADRSHSSSGTQPTGRRISVGNRESDGDSGDLTRAEFWLGVVFGSRTISSKWE